MLFADYNYKQCSETALCDWFLNFLAGRPQAVWMGITISSTLTSNTAHQHVTMTKLPSFTYITLLQLTCIVIMLTCLISVCINEHVYMHKHHITYILLHIICYIILYLISILYFIITHYIINTHYYISIL